MPVIQIQTQNNYLSRLIHVPIYIGGMVDIDWISGETIKYVTRPDQVWNNMIIKHVRVEELQSVTNCTDNEEPTKCHFAR